MVFQYKLFATHTPHTPHISPHTHHTSCTQEEEGICTSKYFSENGLVELLEKAAEHFKEAQLYEAVNEVYKLVLPIYEAKRSHQDVERVYRMLSECYKELVKKGEHRFLGSYFRVGFYGLLFGDLDTQEFIYKEAALTRLGEFSINLQVHEVEGGGERRGMNLLSNVGVCLCNFMSTFKHGYVDCLFLCRNCMQTSWVLTTWNC